MASVSLLDELRKHSIIDLDCNDEAVALQFKPFQDMTSNQLIVLGQLLQPSHAAIFPAACKLARDAHEQFPNTELADLAVDYATVLLGKVVASHLHPTGYVHAQTLPSLAYDTDATVKHAMRLVNLYGLAGIPQNRVCIKIPSTVEGLAACKELEAKYDVRTLATTCFTMAQGLAAAEAKCTYVAPYINPLYVHLEPSRHVVYEDPLPNLVGMQVAFGIQQAYKASNATTKVLAASLVTAEECFALCGLQHITLSSNALALLQKTPLDAKFEGIRDRSLAFVAKGEEGAFWTKDLKEALSDPKVAELQADALDRFGKAEKQLREMAESHLC